MNKNACVSVNFGNLILETNLFTGSAENAQNGKSKRAYHHYMNERIRYIVMLVSAYSERIYKDKLKDDFLDPMLCKANDAKISLYSRVRKGKVNLKKLNTTYVVNKYKLNTYYANMVIRKVKEAVASDEELHKRYLADKEDAIKKTENQIKSLEKSLAAKRRAKQECIRRTKNPKVKTKVVFPYKFEPLLHGTQVTKLSTKETWPLYQFETRLDEKIREMKFIIARKKDKLCRLRHQLAAMEKNGPRVQCFGTRKFFRSQYTVYDKDTHDVWKREWELRRHRVFDITGCKDHLDGSMCVRYNDGVLRIMLPDKQEVPKGKKRAKQKHKYLPCEFKYRADELFAALEAQRTVSYEIDDHGDYYIVKATFDLEEPERLNDYTGDGIIAPDFNIDNITLTETDKYGNYLSSTVIPFDLTRLSAGQSQKVIEDAVLKAYEWIAERKKPLVREDIKDIRFHDTGDPDTNRKLTQFAYDKMITAFDRCMYKNGYMVFKTNPAYTSQEGKIKYMRRLGLSIHEAAAFCIARRGLLSKPGRLYYENLLQYKKFGNVKTVSNELKKLRRCWFYEIEKPGFPVKPENFDSLKDYVKAVRDAFTPKPQTA